MVKRRISILTAIIFIITLLPLSLVQKAYAYTNNSYFNDVRVGLVSMSAQGMTATLSGGYIINGQAYASGTVLNLGMNGTSITMNGTSHEQIILTPNTNGNLLTLTVGAISNKYMGSFLIKIYNGKLLAINTLDMENYLKGVVGYEMSDYFPLEALKAQAVAARNYALSRIGYEAAKGYDFDDTISYQVYKGYNPSFSRVINAVEQTAGQVLLHNDRLVETLYSAWHGGISENSENVWGNIVPYLRSSVDTFENDPWPNGNRVFTNDQIQSTLVTKKYLLSTDTFIKLDLSSITKYPSGRVSNIDIHYRDAAGLSKIKSVTKDGARTFLSLPSSLYTVSYDAVNGVYSFSGKGNGHGLGMSQIGAKNRGAAGQTFEQILKFYYQNSYLQNLIEKATIGSLTKSSEDLLVGNNISFNTIASGGNGYGYFYKYIIRNGSNIVLTKDYSIEATLNFVPESSGSYTVEALVKDKFSISEYDDRKTITFTAYDRPKLEDFSISKSTAFVNEIVNLSAQSSSNGALFKFVITKENIEIATREYSEVNTYDLTLPEAGNYNAAVYIKEGLSQNEYEDVKALNFTILSEPHLVEVKTNKSEYLSGQTIELSASGAEGSGSYLYKYVILRNGVVQATMDYSTLGSLQYTIEAPGDYSMEVYLKDALSQESYDDMKVAFVKAYDPRLQSVSVNGFPYEGMTQSLNVLSLGASPDGISYRFEVYNNGTLVDARIFEVVSTFSFTPATQGIYTIKVYGRDGISTREYDCVKEFDITILSKPLYLEKLPLKYGMTNNDVAALQSALMNLGYTLTDAKGYFGTQTKNSVIAFQKSKGLTKDGIVGNMTYSALNSALIDKAGASSSTY